MAYIANMINLERLEEGTFHHTYPDVPVQDILGYLHLPQLSYENEEKEGSELEDEDKFEQFYVKYVDALLEEEDEVDKLKNTAEDGNYGYGYDMPHIETYARYEIEAEPMNHTVYEYCLRLLNIKDDGNERSFDM